MIDVTGIAIGLAIGAGLLMPLIALRFMPQIVGHFAGPNAKLAALALGVGALGVVVASSWSEHRKICSNGDQEFQCEISSVLITTILCWWALIVLTQIRFVWSTISAVWPKKMSEA